MQLWFEARWARLVAQRRAREDPREEPADRRLARLQRRLSRPLSGKSSRHTPPTLLLKKTHSQIPCNTTSGAVRPSLIAAVLEYYFNIFNTFAQEVDVSFVHVCVVISFLLNNYTINSPSFFKYTRIKHKLKALILF